MSRTLASRSFWFAKTNGGKRRLVTTTCISEANSQEVVTQPATWKEWEDCPMHLAEASTTLRDVSPFGDLPTNRWENNGGCKTPYLLTVRTVRLYRRKPFSLWDAQEEVPHDVNHPLSCYGGRGRGCWSESGYSLQISEDAHGLYNLSMSNTEDSKQYPHEYGMIKLIGTKECYQNTLLQARPDKKWDG